MFKKIPDVTLTHKISFLLNNGCVEVLNLLFGKHKNNFKKTYMSVNEINKNYFILAEESEVCQLAKRAIRTCYHNTPQYILDKWKEQIEDTNKKRS